MGPWRTPARQWGIALLLLGQALAAPAQPSSDEGRLPPGVIVRRDLEYARPDGKPLLLDLYLPEKAAGRLPLILWVHGGAWRAGSKEQTPAVPTVTRGYAVASINYRLSQQATFPAQIEDCKAAVRWLRAHAEAYQLDKDHFGAWGASAGGHLVAMLGTSGGVKALEGAGGGKGAPSSRVQAVCDWFGPIDFLQMSAHAPSDSRINHDAADSPESLLIGGPIQQNKEKVARANPIRYVTRDDPPFLIMHGEQDNLVPIHQSELLHEALKKAGVIVTFRRLPGAGHGGPGFREPKVMGEVERFFDRHLKVRSPRRGSAAVSCQAPSAALSGLRIQDRWDIVVLDEGGRGCKQSFIRSCSTFRQIMSGSTRIWKRSWPSTPTNGSPSGTAR